MPSWQADKDAYLWTMMILQPDVVTPDVFAAIKPEVAKKKALPALDLLRLETYHEGLCAQILHLGPYDAEGPTIQRLHEFIAAQGKQRTGKHHEIYLGDPNKSAPDKLKTIIRQPIGKQQSPPRPLPNSGGRQIRPCRDEACLVLFLRRENKEDEACLVPTKNCHWVFVRCFNS
ncbi:GyrI-like domain-containing protein [Candidatus Flexifilum breve]|uniref:GyrI-like domain-containing protein n=1 Tax=Candidatus Flexifilum breve TaxID=3140694 RepID=UPI0031CC628C